MTPKVRFKGFDDAWEQRKLEELATFSKGKGYSKSDLKKTGCPIILYGRLYTDYSFSINEVDSFADKLPNSVISEGHEVVVPASGETAEEIARATAITVSGIIIGGDLNVISPSEKLNSEFLALTISNGHIQKELSKKAQGKSVVHLHNSDLKELNIFYPCKEEQTKISKHFVKIDNLITLHQRKCEALKKQKQFFLQNMFPKRGESEPRIRFNGFTEPWEQRKFCDTVDKYENSIETPHDGYWRVGVRSHGKGTFKSFVSPGDELETAKMFKVVANNFIVNITFGWEQAVAITKDEDSGCLVSHRFPQYSFKKGFSPDFFKYIILDKNFKNHLVLSSPGGAGRNRVLKLTEMLKYTFCVPKFEEQLKIGAFFERLDNLITLHQQQYEQLVSLKKYLLSKMFI